MNAKKAKQLRRVARQNLPEAPPVMYGQTRQDNFVVAVDSQRGLYRAMKQEAKRQAKRT